MYTQGLLLAGVLLLTLLGPREHLTFTETIKDIRTAADPAEEGRIFAMAPASLQSRARATSPDRPAALIATIIREFQQDVYVPATAPIPEATVDSFVASKRAMYQATPSASGAAFFEEAYSNGDAKRLLMTYLGLTPTGTLPPVAPPPTPSGSGVSINDVLTQFRDTLLTYKLTGDTRYKTSAEGLQAWLDRYVATLSTRLTQEADGITADVMQYRAADTDLAKSQADFQKIRTEGPQLENTYLTVKRQMDQTVQVPDTTSVYVKVGIVAGLVLGMLVLTVF